MPTARAQSCPALTAVAPVATAKVTSPVLFQWTTDAAATGYHLIVQNVSTGLEVFNEFPISQTSRSVSLSPGNYRWRVHAVGGPCQEIDVAPITFMVITCPALTAISPTASAQLSSPVLFQWTADSEATSYHLIVENATTGATVFDEAPVFGTSRSVPLNAASYRWRVHANGGPCQEIDIPPIGFSVLECPAAGPTLQSPPNGATNVSSPVSFSWSLVESATSYELWLSTAGGAPMLVGTTASRTLTASVPVGSHQWHVVAKAPGCANRQSATFSFTIVPAVKPRVTNFEAKPARIRRGAAARLLWSTVEATGVSIAPGVGSVAANGSIEVTPQSTTTYTLTATGPGGTVTAQTVVEVFVDAQVVLAGIPGPMVQSTDAGGGTTSYVLSNIGGSPTTVTLGKSGAFFDQAPESFALAAGASQAITITGRAVTAGTYRGASTPRGDGVPASLSVPIEMLVTQPPSQGTPKVEAVNNRIDVAAGAGANPTGQAFFRNVGTADAMGFVVARVPWIIPNPNLVVIQPCGMRCGDATTWTGVAFSIDRSLRPDGANPTGSVAGALEFVFRLGGSAKSGLVPNNGAGVSSSTVTVVDTSKPPTAPGQIPPLAANETAFFVPGVGHVVGSVGLFLSDVTLVNLAAAGTINDIRMYYTPLGTGDVASQSSSVTQLASAHPVSLADVVKNVFDNSSQIGSLQFRARDIRQIAINANILNVSNPKGTFGTTIPVVRTDRSAGAGESFYLAGLRKSATSHTNLFIQETAGGSMTVDAQFFDASGKSLGVRAYGLAPFRLTGDFDSASNPVLPEGAVTAVLTGRAGSTGRFSAYATPVDRASGDFWAVVDWNRQYAIRETDPILIPVAGRVFGANNSFFRTDVAIVNRGESDAVGSLRYYAREGSSPVDRTIALKVKQSAILDDVIRTFLGLEVGTVGHIVFTPQSGSFGITSRTFSSQVGSAATFGTGVPTLSLESSIRLGETRRIGGVDDASLEAVQGAVAGSFRSNFALVETAGTSAVVRVTLHYSFAASSVVAGRGSATKDYPLGANQFLLLSNIAKEILGSQRDSFGNLSNLQVDFSVIEGNGAVSVFVSSVDNGTADQILRTE